jgi:hypothetical protein
MHISPTASPSVPLAADGHDHRQSSAAAPAQADAPRDTEVAASTQAASVRPGGVDVLA